MSYVPPPPGNQPPQVPPPPGWNPGAVPPPPGYSGGPVYGMPAQTNPFDSKSTTILVLGILGIVVCGILAPIALIMGNNLRKEAAAAGYPEPGNCKAGRICGLIGTILMALAVVGMVLFVLLAATAGTS